MGGCTSSSNSSRPPLLPFLSTPFANYLTSAQLTTFSIYFTELTFTPSSIIFRTGDTAGDYYIFLSGQAHVFAEHKFLCEKAAGDTINTTIITSASLSSPAALKHLSASPLPRHTCSLHAITNTRLLYLSHKKLVEYIRNNPDTSTLLLPLFSCPFVTLSSLAFFSSMPPAHLHTLSCYMLRMQALKPTEMLFEEGSLGQSVYILQAGQLKAVAALTSSSDTKEGKDGKADSAASASHGGETEKVLHIFRDTNADDRIFGEIALCMAIPRTASIISNSNSIVLEWKREDYRTFTSLLQSTAQSMASLQQMMKARTAEHFRKYKVPFFSSIPEEKYAILASLCKIEERGAGEVIFHEGERGSEFYLIAYGQVRVTMKRKKKEGAKGDDSADVGAGKKIEEAGKTGESKAADDGYASLKGGKVGTIKGDSSGTSMGTIGKNSTIGKSKRQTMMGTLRRRRRTSASNPNPTTSSTALLASLLALDDDSVEICRMGPGKYFGEIALVQDTPRTATVTALTRCIILSITKENFTLFFHEAPEAISDFEIKLARYDVQLRSVLYHPLGLQWFRRHCEREYAGENVDFWLRCREYRHRSMEAMGKEREERRKVRRDERVRREKEKAASDGAAQASSPKSAVGRGKEKKEAEEEEKASEDGGKKEGKEGKEEEESAEFADNDYIDAEEDSSDLEYLRRVTRHASFTSHLLSQLSTLFTVFSLSSSISRTTSLTITASQLKSLILMLDIYISDYQLDELCVSLQEHNDTIAFRPLVDACLATTHSPNPSHSTTDRLLRKLCRRICQYDVADVRRVFEQTAKSKRGFLNLGEFTHTLKRLHIRVRSKEAKDNSGTEAGSGSGEAGKENDEQDVSLLFFRLAQPLSFSTRMSSQNFQLSFPIFLSFILNHFHYHESFYAQLLAAAQSMYDTYISSSSTQQVNIKGRTQAAITACLAQQRQYREEEERERGEEESEEERLRRRVRRREKWSSLGVHMFDEGEEEVLNLLGADTFARFKQSELFQEFLNSAQAYVEVKAGSGKADKGAAGALVAGGGAQSATMGEEEREKMRRVGEEIRRGKMLRSGSVVRETEKRQPVTLPPAPKISATLPQQLPPQPAAAPRSVSAAATVSKPTSPSRAATGASAVPPPPARPPPPLNEDIPPPPPPADDFIPPPPSTQSIPPPPPSGASYQHTAMVSPTGTVGKRRGNLPAFNAQLYSSSTVPRQPAPSSRPVVSAAIYAAPSGVQPSVGRGAAGVKYEEQKQQMDGIHHVQPVTVMLDPFQSRY